MCLHSPGLEAEESDREGVRWHGGQGRGRGRPVVVALSPPAHRLLVGGQPRVNGRNGTVEDAAKGQTDGRTGGRTDGRTDGRTGARMALWIQTRAGWTVLVEKRSVTWVVRWMARCDTSHTVRSEFVRKEAIGTLLILRIPHALLF